MVQAKLTHEQMEGILQSRGYSDALLKSTLKQLDLEVSTQKVAEAQKTSVTFVDKLKYAYSGLVDTLGVTTAQLTVWLGVIAGAVAVAAVVKAYNEQQKELASTTKANAQETKNASKELENYTAQYGALRKELLDTNTTEERQAEIKKELLAIQTDLNEKYGDEYGKINLVTDAYKNQTETLKNLNQELAKDWLSDNNEGINQATKEMEKTRSYTTSGAGIAFENNAVGDIRSIVEKYSDQGASLELDDSGIAYVINVTANAEDAQQVLDKIGQEIYDLSTSEKYNGNAALDGLINSLNVAEQQAQSTLDNFKEQYDQAAIYKILSSSTMSTDYEHATNAVKKYNDAVASGDFNSIKEARIELDGVQKSIDLTERKWEHCGFIIEDVFDQANTKVWDFASTLSGVEIGQWAKKLKDYSESELRSMENDGSDGDIFDPLVDSAKEAGLNIDELISLLQQLGIVAIETNHKSLEPDKILNKTEMISALNELSSGFESLDKIMESQNDDSAFDYGLLADKDFVDTFGGLGEAYTDFVETISDSPKDVNACKDAYDELVTAWINANGVLDGISEETANVTEAMLKNMGVVNAAEVVEHALAKSKAEVAWKTRESTDAIADEVLSLLNESETVDDTTQAWAAYIAQKLLNEVHDGTGDIVQLYKVMKALGLGVKAWEAYYRAKNYAQISKGDMSDAIVDEGTGATTFERVSAESSRRGWEEVANATFDEINQQINALIDNSLDIEYGGGNKSTDTDSKSSSSSSSKDPKQEEIDWIARKNELLQKQHDIQEQIANDESASYNERKSALLDLIEQDKERASVAAQSASEYESAWNEVVSGLRATDVSKIIHGSLEIETYDAQELANQGVVGSVEEGEKYIENLKKAIELFDLKEEALLNHKEIEKESLEHQKESIRLLREEIGYQKDLNSAMASQVNSRMDLMEAEGKYITAGSYQELIRLSQEMETLHHDNIDALYEQLELEKEGSAEYYDILAEIESVEDAIIQCQVEQENWNYQIARLPINRIQTYIDMLETIKQDAENWGAEVSVDGISLNMDQYQNLIDINAEEIDALIKQQEKLQDLLNKYDYGSDRFNELSEEIQSVQNQMSSLIQEQKEYNYAILEIPVREMSEQIENLASAKAALERSIVEDNEKGLATTISQYDSLNQLTIQQLQALSKQRDALNGLLSVYDQNSDKYAETKDQLDNINQTISDLVIQQYQWNSEILQIPNDKLEDLNNNLQTYSSILGDSLSEMDSVLSGVIGVIEQQTDAIEEQRKASEDMYDERIERLEKEKELLTSTNNDRKLQLDYEQALYDLDRAQSQRTIQVVRDGKVVHEADQDAIRDAQTAKADAEFNLVINNLEKQIEALETEKETILEGYDEQLDKLDDVKSKWSEIADQIKQAADIAKADKFFGDGWADKVLLGTDSDIFNLFKDLYSSTSEQKESIEEQISSNERLIQMMGEFVDRYKEGSLTYDQALNNISSLIQSMEGGYSALENLSGMMNLDNILGLENITTSTQNQIDKSAELLKQYMQIVESNKQSVEGFETNWESMSESVDFTINAFNNAVDSMQSYLDVFNSNADAINENTSTWEEMKENIESQVEALKKAAEELEKLAKKAESSSSGSGSSSGKSSGGSGKNEIYLSVNGTSYLETSNGYVDKQTGNSGNTAAEVIGKYGSEKEKEDYYELRKNQISKSPQAKNEGWEKAALEALDKEMEKAGVIRYHDGIKNGPVDGKMSDDQLWNYARKIALDPLRADEVVKILQRGEGVFQPEQIRNVMQNSELVGRMSADASALGAVTNLSRNNTIDCSIGQVHLHEVKNPDEFAKAMKQTFASSMRQNFSEVFKK